MSLNLLLRINCASCLIFGLILLLKTDAVNLLIGTEKTMVMHSIVIIFVDNGMLLLIASLRNEIKPHEVMFFVIGAYGWAIITVALISANVVIIDPLGIRVAFVIAMYTAAMGALQFRHYKLLKGRS
jgi:hypothetical protein